MVSAKVVSSLSFCPVTRPLLHVVLDRPRIAANVAALVRLTVGVGAALHICGPLVFDKADPTRWRAGLDYFAPARVHFHLTAARCLRVLGQEPWIIEVGGSRAPWDVSLQQGDVVILGPETGNAVPQLAADLPHRVLTFPKSNAVRCFNLAQCASAVCFEAMRQNTQTI